MTDISVRPIGTMIGPAGTNGTNGTTGYSPGFRFAFSTTTADADPGPGTMRANNATFGSITFLYVDNLDAFNTSVTTWIDSFDDSTTLGNRGFIRLEKSTDPSVYMEFSVTGAVIDGGGYRKIPVSPIAGAIPAAADTLCMFFSRTGDKGQAGVGSGDVVGPASSTIDRIATYADGTGKLIKDSGILITALAPLASPALTGNPTAPTQAPGDNDTSIATTAFVAGSFAPLNNPALTGNPTAPTAAPGDNDTSIATTAFVTAALAGGSSWPLGTINGLTLSRASATTYGIATGLARNEDAGAAANLTLSSAFTKSLSAWASGSGNGSLDTGAIAANTWYHVHIIGVTSTDILLSLSATAPTMPATYTARRRIGSILTNGSSQIVAFIQNVDIFTWDVPVNDVNATNPGNSAVTRTLTVPTGVVVFPATSWFIQNGTTSALAFLITALSITDTAASATVYTGRAASNTTVGAAATVSKVPTNTSGQVRSRLSASGASDVLTATTHGWRDTRGQ